MNFVYNLPLNLLFGRGMSGLIGKETAKYGKKALIVTGGSSTKKSGLLDKAVSLLKDEGIGSIIFDKVTPNPTDLLVYEGAKLARNEGCDVVIGLGGGSSMDCAKGIAFAFYNEGNLFDYIYGIKTGEKSLPIVLVTTTAGTGSEGNNIAVITNTTTNDKKGLKDGALYPKASIIDPVLMQTMPKNVLASVGFDAFCHSLEAYISKNAQPISDIYAYRGMKLLIDNLINAYNNPNDNEAFDNISFANTLGGMAICIAGVCAPHGMEHPASGLHNVTHGEGLAALLPNIIKRIKTDKLIDVVKLFGGSNIDECYELINEFLKKINLNVKLSELGVKYESIDWMTNNSLNVMKKNLEATPIELTYNDVKNIYLESF